MKELEDASKRRLKNSRAMNALISQTFILRRSMKILQNITIVYDYIRKIYENFWKNFIFASSFLRMR